MSEIEPNAAPEAAPRTGLSNGVLAVVFVVILAILGGGGWVVYDTVVKTDDTTAVLPASVLPASTLAVATVNASPSMSQKIDLFNVISKFPALKSKVTIGAKDDPRKWVVDQILKKQSCPSVSYAKDFAPWLGNHFALGAVQEGSATAPVAALETTDGSAATAALNKMVSCSGTNDFIFRVVGRYVVASDSTVHLNAIINEAQTSPLSTDPGYLKWSNKVGNDGILSFYVAPAGLESVLKMAAANMPGQALNFKTLLGEFKGMAGSLGATGDGLELKMAIGSSTIAGGTSALGDEIAKLPADTAIVLGIGMSSSASGNFAKGVIRGLGEALRGPRDQALTDAETKARIKQYTGLDVPGDITTLLGKAIVLSLGGNAPSDLSSLQSPMQLPLGLKIKGDPARIKAVIAKIEAKVGGTLAQMGFTSKVSGDDFVLATNQGYANAITTTGTLGSDPAFQAAVPDAAQARSLFFVRVDSAWRTAIMNMLSRMGLPNASDIAANTAGLSALGIASWTDGDAGMVDVKLTTK